MAAITALYVPPIAGLPYLAVVILQTGEIDVTPFPSKEEGEAYLEICDAGMAADAIRATGALNG